MRLILLLACLSALAHCQSISSCGKPGDKLANATFTVSPDPIDKDQPLTITATGTLTEALTAGKFDVDLQVKALGIINEPVKISAPFTASPGLPAGASKIVVGPFTLPKVPGSVEVSGQIVGSDSSGAEVFCLKLDLNLGSAAAPVTLPPPSASEAIVSTTQPMADPISDCGTDADHMHNRSISDAGGILTASGDLDEDITSCAADVDLDIKVLFISVPIKLNIPISISPAIPKGPIKLSVGPAGGVVDVSRPDIKVTVKGQVKVNDGNAQQVLCLAVDAE